MGKKLYAEKLYSHFDIIYDMKKEEPENIKYPSLIINFHMGIKNLVSRNIDACKFFMSRIEILKHCVIIGDDISGGVVPADKFSRRWRDETGLVYQVLAREADIVDRIFAGLAIRLKG